MCLGVPSARWHRQAGREEEAVRIGLTRTPGTGGIAEFRGRGP